MGLQVEVGGGAAGVAGVPVFLSKVGGTAKGIQET